jgi:inositol phosphorylceramide mannosyltransferase catalytic subunit
MGNVIMSPRDFLKNRLLPRLNVSAITNVLPDFPEGGEIPKILHQTFYDRSSLQPIQENIEKLCALNRGWEYRFYGDSDMVGYIRNHYSEKVLAYFNRINPVYGAARADLFRYLLIYQCGGVYLDIKSTLTKPLDTVLRTNDRYLLSQWQNKQGERHAGWDMHPGFSGIARGEYQQWHIIAAPGHPFLKAVIERVFANIDNYVPALHGVGKIGVHRVTGPVAYTLAIAPLLNSYEHRFVEGESDLGLEYSVFRVRREHNQVFANHYAGLKEPIVAVQGARRLLDQVVDKAIKTMS